MGAVAGRGEQSQMGAVSDGPVGRVAISKKKKLLFQSSATGKVAIVCFDAKTCSKRCFVICAVASSSKDPSFCFRTHQQ